MTHCHVREDFNYLLFEDSEVFGILYSEEVRNLAYVLFENAFPFCDDLWKEFVDRAPLSVPVVDSSAE